jgi:hypothetical protein
MTKKSILASILAIFAVAVAACFFAWPTIYRALDAWKLVPHEEKLTELYIADYNALPKAVVPGQVVPFTFVIHNLEGTSTVYRYTVSAGVSSTTRQTIASGVMQATSGEYKDVLGSYTVGSTTASTTIYIELPDQALSLHFMVPRR